MRILLRPLSIAVGLTLALVLLAMALGQLVQTVLAWTLVGCAVLNLWLNVLLAIINRRRPGIPLLKHHLERSVLTTLASALVAVVAANFLTGSHLPPGSGFVVLAVGVLLISAPAAIFLLDFARGKL